MLKKKHGFAFIVGAPSGTGKTTVVERVLKHLASQYPISRVVTYTSRSKRIGEKDGRDYFFLSPQEFRDKKKQGFFLETTIYDENYYGSPSSVLADLAKGQSFIFVVDRAGAKILKQLLPDPVLIWLEPPSIEELKKRLLHRGKSTEIKTQKRLELAEKEIKQEKENHLFQYHIINDDLNLTVEQVERIILSKLQSS